MSKYKQTIQAFIDIINAQAIPAEESPDLLKFVEEMPEDYQEIAEKIDNWLKPESRSKIKETYRLRLRQLPNIDWNYLGFGGVKIQPGNESESAKKLILNAIKKNTPEPKQEEENSDNKSSS